MIKRVKPIGFQKLVNAVHLNFHNEAYNFMLACGADNISCQNELPLYKIAIEAETEMLKLQQASAITPELDILDDERDLLIRHLFSLLDVGKYSPIAKVHEAYNNLLPVMKNYRGIESHSLSKETAEIDTMLNEMRASKLSAYIATMAMEDVMLQLEEKNKQYVALDMQRINDKPARKDTIAARKNCDDAYNYIVFKLDGTIAINKNDHADKLSDNLTNLVNQTNHIYKLHVAQTGKKNNTEETNEE